ncbi:uncharacterized protein [Epargyreus clarus]|uniref:uncharacterized protein n=1 Tax=Epargyreus clarus TaxID=520877 RepID=UPI003C2FD922
MRGRTSSAQSRLRSGGYKCNLCGRRVIDAATLDRHHKTVHSLPSRAKKGCFKAKAPVQKAKTNNAEKTKAFEDLVRDEILAEAKPKPKTKTPEIRVRKQEEILAKVPEETEKKEVAAKNGDQSKIEEQDDDKKSKNNAKGKLGKRKVEFLCPVCERSFNIYFTAHRHIQNFHPINSKGKKVPPNSLDLVQPIRVEQCVKCSARIRSTEVHVCQRSPDDCVDISYQYNCTACSQSFVTLKMFDMHVSGLHSDGVESMFFAEDDEFNEWRQDMENQTNIKYKLLGEYDSKKVYRCQFATNNDLNNASTSHFCPSMMVAQDFSKGTQVHFYKRHYGHQALTYILPSKYNKYSINAFLKNPDVGTTVAKTKVETKDNSTYAQFKTLMESIILDAKHVDNARLKTLTEKALQMTALLSINDCITVLPKANKSMSDKEITDVLESKHPMRRRSMDVAGNNPSAAKRLRNKSIAQTGSNSPKIVNSFSLANDETDPLQIKEETNVTIESPEAKPKGFRATRFSQSPSFNDTYKDFVDQTIKATIAADKTKTRDKNKLANKKITKPTSPKTVTEQKVQEVCINIATSKNDLSVTPEPVKPKCYVPKFKTKPSKESPNNEVVQENITPIINTPPSIKKIKPDFEYEIREQENDCNILILKI